MKSLREAYQAITAKDQEKVAAVQQQTQQQTLDAPPELIKQAAEWDAVGRELAHHTFIEMMKEAAEDMPSGHGPGKKHEDGMPCTPECPKFAEEALSGAEGEKRASAKAEILERMAQDPAYVAQLIQKHAAALRR
jgi:hypothetical protein